jgi:putative transposase
MARQSMMVGLAQTVEAIDPQPGIGRPRVWSSLITLQALWHLTRDGCTWRRLPCCFPPHTTVWGRLCRWRKCGVLERALAVVVACHRFACGRKKRPTAAIVDTQSVRTGPQAGPQGYDAGKKIRGRKRVLIVDTDGNLLGVQVVPADTHDHRALLALQPDLAAHPSLLLIWLDKGFPGEEPAPFLGEFGIAAEIVHTPGRQGLVLEKRRWKAEQVFGNLQRYRRLRVDEMSCDSSRGMSMLASLFMTGMRLERAAASA